ncbi:hypothetical protein A9993_02205 [Rahnella victoriana]|uniref:hypothetical protein n=1 Tax=Rahnella victoriana TaxID=1510570 RepID=UPI000BB1C24F|nr:hypothetical protein [Rahnella victoriana]PBI78601.1 hypothetical protein A9993_02205 [Rahnella victoriana]
MARDITLDQAVERASQAEVILMILECYPHQLEDSELLAIVSLLKRLTGNVAAWLIEEQAEHQVNQEVKNND